MRYTNSYSVETERLKKEIETADAIVIGAGAGLSTAAGFTYSGKRFEKFFSDFEEKYGFHDMYSGGFFPFETPEEMWAYWSRFIWCNRYMDIDNGTYKTLFELMKDKDYFVITTNVDHQFQKAGFDKTRLFYTQGDYGLFQCSEPCHAQTYDNETQVKDMIEFQEDMKIPTTRAGTKLPSDMITSFVHAVVSISCFWSLVWAIIPLLSSNIRSGK